MRFCAKVHNNHSPAKTRVILQAENSAILSTNQTLSSVCVGIAFPFLASSLCTPISH
jgi:hypothetical protein